MGCKRKLRGGARWRRLGNVSPVRSAQMAYLCDLRIIFTVMLMAASVCARTPLASLQKGCPPTAPAWHPHLASANASSFAG